MHGIFLAHAARVTEKLELAEVRASEYKAEVQKTLTKTDLKHMEDDTPGTNSLQWGLTSEWLPGLTSYFKHGCKDK